MKSLKILFLFGLFALTFSCGSDDSDSPSSDDLLVAEWTLTGLTYTGTSSTTGGYIPTTAEFEGEGRDIDATVVMRDDMTYTSQGSYTIDFETEVAGYSFSQPITISNFLGQGTWERDGMTLITQDASVSESGISQIIELTEDTFVLDFGLTTVMTQQGITSTMTIDGRYTFVR